MNTKEKRLATKSCTFWQYKGNTKLTAKIMKAKKEQLIDINKLPLKDVRNKNNFI